MDRYEILEKLGAGGFSCVYKVKDQHIGTIFAAKEINNPTIAEAEISWLRILEHPGLPRLHDVVETESSTVIIMEYMKGETLKEHIIKNGALNEEYCRNLIIKLTELLTVLHSQNIPVIHGDLKPENIILGENGHVSLLDLGSASFADDSDSFLYGTKGYVAPERMEGRCLVQNDIYSVGKIMQYILTGCEPSYFSSYTSEAVMQYFGVAESLARIIICSTNTDPEQRYVSAAQLLDAISGDKDCSMPHSVRITKVWFVVAAVFLLLAGLFCFGDNVFAGRLFAISGCSLSCVGVLVMRAEKEECATILRCEYSLVLAE